jgi:hypothetical protein
VRNWLYVLACVLVPLAWGIVSTIAMRWVERRLQRRHPGAQPAESESQEPMWHI